MPKTNPKTPKGWQRVRVHGGLAFKGKSMTVRRPVLTKQEWAIYDAIWREGSWELQPRDERYSTWWDAVQAANGGVE